MYKTLIHYLVGVLFTVLIPLLKPFPALAVYQESYKGITFTVEMTPSEIIAKRDRSATITVTSDKPFFNTSIKYGLKAETSDINDRLPADQCNFFVYGSVKSDTRLVFDLTQQLSSRNRTSIITEEDMCLHQNKINWGIWKTAFWSAHSPDNTFIKNFTFTVLPSGGASPKIYAANSPVYYTDDPIVYITNLEKEQDYSLWWNDDLFAAASNGGDNDTKWIAKSDGSTYKTLLNPNRGKVMKPTLKLTYGRPNSFNGVKSIAEVEIKFTDVPATAKKIECAVKPDTKVDKNQPIQIEVKNTKANTDYTVKAFDSNNISLAPFTLNSFFNATIYIPMGKLSSDTYRIQVMENSSPDKLICPEMSVQIGTPSEKIGKGCKRGEKDCATSEVIPIKGCNEPNDPNNLTDPVRQKPGIQTAIGCIHTNPAELAKDFLKFGIGIGGGLAFLMMLLGAFQMITSGGNPETLAAGKSRLTSAVIGLLFIIFAVLLLQIVGADILKLPGFER